MSENPPKVTEIDQEYTSELFIIFKLDNLELPTCTPLRRHSYSSPAALLLEACQAKVLALSDRVTRTTAIAQRLREQNLSNTGSQTRQSLPDLRQSTLVSMSGRTCHHCHAPQADPAHVGIPTGVGHCTLPHWEDCTLHQPDGYDKHKKFWTGCPEQESPNDDTEEEGDAKADLSVGNGIENEDHLVTVKQTGLPATVSEAADSIAAAAAKNNRLFSVEDTDDEEERLALEEVEVLRKRVELQAQQISADKAIAMKLAKKEKKNATRLKIEQQRADLLLREKVQLQERAALTSASRLSKPVPSTKSSLLKTSADVHAAKQQQSAADRDKLVVDGLLNMDGIRKLSGMPQQVEDYLKKIQSAVPSLARDPSAVDTSGVQFQPSGVLDHGGLTSTPAIDTGYVYVAELGKLVPAVSSLGSVEGTGMLNRRQAKPENTYPDSEVSAEDDCPVSPSPGYRLAWKTDSHGVKYCKEVKLREKSPEIVTAWVKRSDGRIYKEQVTRTENSGNRSLTPAKVTAPMELRTPVFVDHRRPERQCTAAVKVPTKREDRQPSFIASDERAGKESAVPNLVKRARSCPVAWTDKITSDQLNPIVWSWAYIADLLAARSGQAPDLVPGELEARLQHFLNVMEVTLQTSSKTDYIGESWKVARLYHTKVQAKVDVGATSWCRMVDRWDNATLPHELMAAQQELAPRQTRNKNRETEKPKDVEGRVPRCGSYNTWETKGTCEWESENPGKKCNRLHECTYCKTKKFRPVNHQRLYCPKRLAAGTD